MASSYPATSVLMIAPTRFGFNAQAAVTNPFQQDLSKSDGAEQVQKRALEEFNGAVRLLEEHGVEVVVISDKENTTTPDSIFPNNWFSTHPSGELFLYPMAVPNRREERRPDVIEQIKARVGTKTVVDFSGEEENKDAPVYLEGTGSVVLDHQSKFVYAALSPRTNKVLVERLAAALGYTAVTFNSLGREGEAMYHTNVMMCSGESFVAVGLDTLASDEDRQVLTEALESTTKELILLSNDQVYKHFAGNMLQVANKKGEKIIVMSTTARASLTEEQVAAFKRHNDHIVAVDVSTIELVGGGSARCMMGELFPAAA